jgi:hypothetical protein
MGIFVIHTVLDAAYRLGSTLAAFSRFAARAAPASAEVTPKALVQR